MPGGSTRRGRDEVCRILLHIAAKMRILSKNFVIFPYCNKGGGGYNLKKCALHKKERKKHKKV